jgi:hypothetical protein
MTKPKTKIKSKELKGKIIHQGDIHDVICNGKNHYAVSRLGTELQCGCFCKKPKFKKYGFTMDLLRTPSVKDGVKIEKSATMLWLEEQGIL